MSSRSHGPFQQRPVSAVPEQDVHGGETSEHWRQRVRQQRLADLDEHLPTDLTEFERARREWFVGMEDEMLSILIGWLARSRQEAHQQGYIAAMRDEAATLRGKADEHDESTTNTGTALRRLASGMERRADRHDNS